MIIDQNLKVLMDGLYDPNSNLSLLRMPVVRSPLMKMIWDKVTEDWQVFSNHPDDHWWHNVLSSYFDLSCQVFNDVAA